MDTTRRQILSATVGAASVGALAGCTDGTNNATTQASFFVFGDLAGMVTGDATTVETLVPIGQHGHGWEPTASVRKDIRDAELLFHNMEGFQPWLDNIASELDADGAETTTVDVSKNVDLLDAGGGHDDHDDHKEDNHDDHEEDDHDDHDHDDHEEDSHDDHEEDGHNDHEEDGHDEHDHTGMDPHFWMDPIRVKTAVDTMEAAFADADTADTADSYDDNAAALREQLDDLHAEIESVVETGSKDVLLIAGHDSFSYFADRYGIEVIALTGVGPDDEILASDRERARDVIETHGLDYICADPLESQQAAEQLVADTDAAEVLPLTAMPGLTEEWADNDWGYLDIMESVNLPTLEQALDS